MYDEADYRGANRCVRRWQLRLFALLVPLLASYALCVVLDRYALMLLALLVGFICSVAICDFALLPALRYRRFLRDMRAGLRRENQCILLSLEEKTQIQDGAQVRVLHVALDAGDERIFYVNACKVNLLPEMQRRVCLMSCGRHVVDCVLI